MSNALRRDPFTSDHPFPDRALYGGERIPAGAALLVGNHGPLGCESLLFLQSILTSTGRLATGLAERWYFQVPSVRDALGGAASLFTTPRGAYEALRRGELVACYPGGAREVAPGPTSERYRLRWDHSFLFIRLALASGVPIVPFATVSEDVTEATDGSPIAFQIGDPIRFRHGPEAVENPIVLRALHRMVWSAAQSLLDEAVARASRPSAPTSPVSGVRKVAPRGPVPPIGA